MDVLRKNIDIDELLEPLERAISDALIPSITGHTCTTSERELLALPVRKGGLGLENPVGWASWIRTRNFSPGNRPSCWANRIRGAWTSRQCSDKIFEREREERRDDKSEHLRNSLPEKTKRAFDLAAEKGVSSWLTVIPVKEMDLNHNKREFKDAVHERYDWQMSDVLNVCVCGSPIMSIMQWFVNGGASL